jgi:hypothetical protein
MDLDRNRELDQILERTSASALKSLDAVVDVNQHLRDLHRDVELELAASPHRSAIRNTDR